MAGLEGDIKTPLGPVSKKTAAIGGALLAVIIGVVWYRSKQQAAQDAASQAGANTGIDPATGYPYGSAEDAAALESQGAYINPTQPYAPGGGGGTNAAGGFTSNAQWVQAAEQYIVGEDIGADSGKILTALGNYVTGAPVSGDDIAIIHQAIGVEGYPPVAGPNGYPPSINTANPTPTTPPTNTPPVSTLPVVTPVGGTPSPVFNPGTAPKGKPSTPSNVHVYTTGPTWVGISWNQASGVPYGYRVYLNGRHIGDTQGDRFTYSALKAGTYTLGVSAYNVFGDSAIVSIKGSTSR